MLTEQKALAYISRRIPDSIFRGFPVEFYIDILNDETLPTYSTYYPYVVRGIRVTGKDIIHSMNPTISAEGFSRYNIPITNKGDEYFDISTYYLNGQGIGQAGLGYAQSLSDAMHSRLLSAMPGPGVHNTIMFEEPNIARIEPAMNSHVDFTLNMKRVRKIYEIPLAMRNRLFQLFLGDVKIALYNDLREIEDGGIYNGVEIKGTAITSLDNGEDIRNTEIEFFESDYYKNPERFEEIMGFNDGY